MGDAKADVERLLGAVLPFAEHMLVEHGEFYPFGGGMKADGEIISVGGHDGREHPPSKDIIELLAHGFKDAAAANEYIATAIVYDVRVIPPGDLHPTDALAAELEHSDGYAVTVYFPYRLEDSCVNLGEGWATPDRRGIFGPLH